MSESPVTRGRFLRAVGAAGTAAVGLSIAATPRHLAAIVSGKATLKKVANLKALKAGVNGSYKFSVEGMDPNTHEIFLVRAGSKVTALEGTCRHKGCPNRLGGRRQEVRVPLPRQPVLHDRQGRAGPGHGGPIQARRHGQGWPGVGDDHSRRQVALGGSEHGRARGSHTRMPARAP